MTPLILGKRHVKHLSGIIPNMPPAENLDIHNNGIRRYSYSVPSVAHIIGPKLIKFMGLRSNYTVNIEMVDAETDSHKHNDSGTGRDAIYLVNIGAKPFTLLYTDPRVNTEYMHIVEVGTSFILSTTHPYTVINAHNRTPAIYFSVNAYENFSNTVRRFQHQW